MVIDIASGTRANSLTIFLVLDANDMHNHVDAFLEEVKTIRLKGKNKVFLLTDRIRHKHGISNLTQYELSLSELIYNSDTNETVPVQVPIRGADPSDGFAWLEALRQTYCLNNPRFSTLITWSHGSGIGVSNPDSLTVIEKNQFVVVRNVRPTDAPLPGCPQLEQTGNALIVNDFPDGTRCRELKDIFVSQIAVGFEGLPQKPVFDMMVMANCNMQIIDNCYNLRKIARFYFAPITAVQLSGYDFARFIKFLNNDRTGWTGLPFARSLFYKRYCKTISRLFINGYIRLNPTLGKSAAIVANDLRHMHRIPLLLNDICTFFNDHYERVYPVIDKLLLDGSLQFSETDFIDAVLFFDAVQQAMKDKTFDELYDELKQRLLNVVVFDRHIGSELKPSQFHCFSIYIPRTIEHVITRVFCCQYFQQFGGSAFVADTHWDNFVGRFTAWRANNQGYIYFFR